MYVYAMNGTGHVKYQFIRLTIDVYGCGMYNGMPDLDPFASLEEVSQGLWKSLCYAATNAFLHSTIGNAPMHGKVTINSCINSLVIWKDPR